MCNQMPALKMKRKSGTDCAIGDNLHPHHKPTKVSKVSCCQVKTFQQSATLNDSFQSPCDACSNTVVSSRNIDINEDNDRLNELAGDSPELLNSPSLPTDPVSIGQMEPLSVACPSDLSTFFSPNFEYDDSLFKIMNHNSAVGDEHIELPRLVADDSDDGSCTSSDFQSYNELDFYVAENAPDLPFDRDMRLGDVMNSVWPDFDCVNSDIMIDMTDRYMLLPFLEKTNETNIHDEDWIEGVMMNSDDDCFYLAIHHMKSDQENDISYCLGDLEESDWVDEPFVFRNLPELSEADSAICPSWIPKETRERKPITLVLDLDETLVHSSLEHCLDADFTFQLSFDMKQHTVYVRRRPYLQMFLERVAELFEVVIFTASQSIYAEQLLDILDPERNLISQRMFRESCIFSDGGYTKDLTILGVDLAKVAIIDNTPQVFRLQVNNGIPIKSWFDDPTDSALLSLLPFLETLVDADDVRPIIAKKYSN